MTLEPSLGANYLKKKAKSNDSKIKRFINKLKPKTKQVDHEVIRDCKYKGLELDAVPDLKQKQAEHTPSLYDNMKDFGTVPPTSEETNKQSPEGENENATSTPEENFNQNEKHTGNPSSEDCSKNRGMFTKNETNITINGGTGIHIGTNNIYTVNNMVNNASSVTTTRIEKTEAVRKLNKNKEKLSPKIMEFLSHHFGKQWEAIGTKSLGMTSGQIDGINEKFINKNQKEKAFQLLKMWSQKRGDATIGELCKTLWNGKIPEAMEAVKALSENIDKFQ